MVQSLKDGLASGEKIEPFAVSEQYKKSWNAKAKAASPEEQEEEPKKPKKGKQSKSGKKKKKAKAVLKGEPVDKAAGDQAYKPQAYNSKRLEWIEECKAEGYDFKTASNMWSSSEERRQILATLSVPRLHYKFFGMVVVIWSFLKTH